jgi:hypothetical protein
MPVIQGQSAQFYAETHAKRQVTQHGFLPCLLGDGDKEIEIVYGVFCTGPTRAARLNKNLVYRHDKPSEPTKEGHLLCEVWWL